MIELRKKLLTQAACVGSAIVVVVVFVAVAVLVLVLVLCLFFLLLPPT